jgi:isohexenylglutaconyl-CoA hydratase
MTEPAILTARADAVFSITLNRPAQRNAMSLAMVTALRAALTQAESDPDTRIILLRGAAGNFCAGGDIADMAAARAQLAGAGADPIAQLSEQFGHLCAAFAKSPKPVIAILEGAVIGGGFGLACVADIAIATENVKFRLTETTLGLIPAQIAPVLVARLGFSVANRLALTAATLSGWQAHDIGLVHDIAESPADLEEILKTTIIAIKKSPPGALAATKSLLRRAASERPEALIRDAAALFAQAARGAEAQEGMIAFLQKRAPSWAETTK